jgi:CheY-like chemotaxis protein
MTDFLLFEEKLREALQKLHNPGFLPAKPVCLVLGCSSTDNAGEAQVRLIQTIKELDPGDSLPADSQPRRIFEFLTMRFVHGMTQEEIADRLHMSVRNLQRIQPEAVHVLALHIWQQYYNPDPELDWQSQVEKELSSLETSRTEASAEVQLVVDSLLELKDHFFSIYGVETRIGFIQPGIATTTHPSMLRQIFISIIVRLARQVMDGKIEIFAGLEDGKVKISITGQMAAESTINVEDITIGIPVPAGANIQVTQNEERLFVQIWLPSSGKHVVLVIEDNPDVVHYYRRCTAGTNFQIMHATQAAQVIELVRTVSPEVIVLDVMMPDIDGWQMLTHLHENPETRDIPVVVCSIIQEPDLALALGAVSCLTKPVKFQQFNDALSLALQYSPGKHLPSAARS